MESSKKLTRGLEDVSPLFGPTIQPPAHRPAEIQILSVSSPRDEGDSLLLNTYFASRVASSQKPCSLISLLSRAANLCPWRSNIKKTEPFGQHIKRHSLFWDELKDVLEAGKQYRIREDRHIFLDFEYFHLLYFPKLLSLLDKWVLLLKPTPESLTEGYKMIKAGLSLNPFMECFVLLESKVNPPSDSSIFEKFAALVSKHLNFNVSWLGWLDLSDPDHAFSAELNVDQLQFQPSQTKVTLEKMILAGWIEANEKNPELALSHKGGMS